MTYSWLKTTVLKKKSWLPGSGPRAGALLAVLLLMLSLPAYAIMMRHDTGYTRYLAREADHPALFPLGIQNRRKVCVATLIAPRWAITAAHCVEQSGLLARWQNGEVHPVRISRRMYAVKDVYFHPAWSPAAQSRLGEEVDLALLYLDGPVDDVQPLPLYRRQDETGQIVTLAGWGYAGTGERARRFNDGRLRVAENTVLSAADKLRLRFDDPRTANSPARPMEGIPGLGDSGGPALLRDADGQFLLAGIAVGEVGSSPLASGATALPPQQWGAYGATIVYERISRHLSWIDQVSGMK